MQAGIPIRDLAWNVVEEALNRQNLRQPVPDLSNPEIGDPVRLLERPRGHVRALQQGCFNEPLDEHGLPKSGPQPSTKVKCDDARQRLTQQPACQGGILGGSRAKPRASPGPEPRLGEGSLAGRSQPIRSGIHASSSALTDQDRKTQVQHREAKAPEIKPASFHAFC